MKDTDSINMYKNMRETLVYLTHLDYADTERIMTEKLQNQVSKHLGNRDTSESVLVFVFSFYNMSPFFRRSTVRSGRGRT